MNCVIERVDGKDLSAADWMRLENLALGFKFNRVAWLTALVEGRLGLFRVSGRDGRTEGLIALTVDCLGFDENQKVLWVYGITGRGLVVPGVAEVIRGFLIDSARKFGCHKICGRTPHAGLVRLYKALGYTQRPDVFMDMEV